MNENELNVKITADISQAKAALGEGSNAFDGYMARVESATRKFQEGGLGISEYSKALDRASKSYSIANDNAEKFSLSTVGAKREVVVLAHEMVSGNFSRIPGSLMVLMERMGGLSLSVMGVGAAVGVAAYGFYEWFVSAQEAERSTNQLNVALQAMNISYATDEVKSVAEEMAKLPNVSREAADALANGLARAGKIGGQSLHDLAYLVRDFASITGQKLPDAEKEFIKAFEEPISGVKALQAAFHDQLDPALTNNAVRLAKLGDLSGAQAALFEALSQKASGAAEGGLTSFDRKLNDVYNTMSGLWGMMKQDWASSSFGGFITGTISEAPKEPTKSAGQMQDEAEVKALIDAEYERNMAMNKALTLARGMTTESQKQVDLERKITQLKEQATVAKNSGQTENYRTLTQGAEAYQEQLDKLSERNARRAEMEAMREARERSADLTGTLQVENEKYNIKAQYIEMDKEAKTISLKDEHDLLIQNLLAQREMEQQNLSDQLEIWQEGTREYVRVLHERELALQRSKLKEAQINRQYTREVQKDREKEVADFKSRVISMQNSFNHTISSMILGTKSFSDGVRSMALSFAESMITAILEVGERWVATQIMEMAFGKTTNASIIAGHAGEAFSAAYASISAIPFIGPFIAPPIAAEAGAAALAGGLAISAASGGWGEIPNDQLAMVHQKEMILPAQLAEGVRNMIATGNTGQGGGPTHITIHAVDAKSIQKLLTSNGGAVAKALAQQTRSFNSNLNGRH